LPAQIVLQFWRTNNNRQSRDETHQEDVDAGTIGPMIARN
jgi:hypothetical protein